MPVFHPERRGTVLLTQGVELDQPRIQRLREIHCQEVWIRYPGLEEIGEYVCPEVIEAHHALTGFVGSSFDEVLHSAHAPLEFDGYKRGVSGVLELLRDRPRARVYVQELIDFDRPLLRHAANVCMMSLLIGLKLDFYLVQQRPRLSASAAQDVVGLGVGGLLHDIGMLRLDAETLARWDKNHDERDEGWQRHAELGYSMVRGGVDPSASSVVLHHHQRYDGGGFPSLKSTSGETKDLSGSDIHVFARIVAVCDYFDRLRHSPDGPEGLMPVVRVLSEMREPDTAARFDPMVMKALVSVVPPYGPGTIVKLSDGRSACVVAWNPAEPCRPVVRILPEFGGPNDRFVPLGDRNSDSINLARRPELHVAEVDGEDVSDANFGPSEPGEFDLDTIGRDISNGVYIPPEITEQDAA